MTRFCNLIKLFDPRIYRHTIKDHTEATTFKYKLFLIKI